MVRFHSLLILSLLAILPGAGRAKEEMTGEAVRKHERDLQIHQRGRALYQRTCAFCHQRVGEGMGVVFPPLAKSEWVEGDPTLAIKIVLKGMFGRVQVRGKIYTGAMLPFEDQLTDQQIAEVLTYVRQSWGNDESPVSAEKVAQVRQESAAQTEMWEAAELRTIEE